MAQFDNLTPGNVGALRETFDEQIKKENPLATMTAGPSEKILRLTEHKKISERLGVLEEKLDSVLNKLANIFGDAVLVDGRWVNVSGMGKAGLKKVS